MNFGQWVYKKLVEIDRSQEWLYRQCKLIDHECKISTGAVQRWMKSQEPSLSTFITICQAISRQEHRPVSEITAEFIEYTTRRK